MRLNVKFKRYDIIVKETFKSRDRDPKIQNYDT